MKILAAICVVLMMPVVRGLASPPKLASLPEPWSEKYEAGPYIKAAAKLQKMGRESACQTMLHAAHGQPGNQGLIVLCRMLFTERRTSEFRPPILGAPRYLAGADFSDWSQTPIELVDNVPFLITQGYNLAGLPETAEAYLKYCVASCDWSSVQYRQPTTEQMHAALAKLLASAKWRRPLQPVEREFLSAQVE